MFSNTIERIYGKVSQIKGVQIIREVIEVTEHIDTQSLYPAIISRLKFNN